MITSEAENSRQFSEFLALHRLNFLGILSDHIDWIPLNLPLPLPYLSPSINRSVSTINNNMNNINNLNNNNNNNNNGENNVNSNSENSKEILPFPEYRFGTKKNFGEFSQNFLSQSSALFILFIIKRSCSYFRSRCFNFSLKITGWGKKKKKIIIGKKKFFFRLFAFWEILSEKISVIPGKKFFFIFLPKIPRKKISGEKKNLIIKKKKFQIFWSKNTRANFFFIFSLNPINL